MLAPVIRAVLAFVIMHLFLTGGRKASVAIERAPKALVKKLLGKRHKSLLSGATYGSSLMKALTTIAEFWDASFSKTSFWFWSGSAPARSERLRNAMNGLLLI